VRWWPLLLLVPISAEAKLVDTTRGLGAGKLTLAVEGAAFIESPNPIYLNLHERVGLAGGVGLYLEQLIRFQNSSSVRLGGGGKWTVLADNAERPGLALWLGGFYDFGPDAAGIAATFMIDNSFGRLTPYGALNLDAYFLDGIDPRLSLIGGLRLGLATNIDLFVEGGLGLTGRDPKDHFASAGLRLTF